MRRREQRNHSDLKYEDTLHKKPTVKQIGITVVVVIIALVVVTSPKTTRWEEEVLLSSGEKIHILRTTKFKDNKPIGMPGDGWAFETARIDFKGNSKVKKWDAPLYPILMDTLDTKLIIVASPQHCHIWHAYGRPVPPYVQFTWDGQDWLWQNARLDARFYERATNLVIEPKSVKSEIVLTADKATLNEGMPKNLLKIKAVDKYGC